MLHLDATFTSICEIGWFGKAMKSGSSANMPIPREPEEMVS